MFTIFTLSNPLDFPLHTTYCTHIDKAPIIFEHIRLHFMSRLLFSNRNSSIFKPKAIQYSQYLYWVTHWIIAKNGVACSYFRLLKKKNTKYFLGLRTWWGEMCQQKRQFRVFHASYFFLSMQFMCKYENVYAFLRTCNRGQQGKLKNFGLYIQSMVFAQFRSCQNQLIILFVI